MMSPRPTLMPGTSPRSSTGSAASVCDELGQHLAGDHEALHADVGLVGHALRGGGEVAHRAAHADDPVAGAGEPGLSGQRLAHVRAHPLQVLLLRRPGAGEELLGDPHGAERERAAATTVRRSATSISCMLPPPISSTMPSVIVELLIAAT